MNSDRLARRLGSDRTNFSRWVMQTQVWARVLGLALALLVGPSAFAQTEPPKPWEIIVDHLEFVTEGDGVIVLSSQAWVGSSQHKGWLRLDTALPISASLGAVELQGLYSYALGENWELQGGLRHDLNTTPALTYGAIGLQGVTPQDIELDLSAFVRTSGDLSFAATIEYDVALTEQLILQASLELVAALGNDETAGLKSGIPAREAAMRMVYRVNDNLSPYLALVWERHEGFDEDGAESELLFAAGLSFSF